MPLIADDAALKARLGRVYALRGTYAAAGASLGLSRQQMRQFLTQPGGFTGAKKDLLEGALASFENSNAERLVGVVAAPSPDEREGGGQTLQNPSIPDIAQDVLRFVLESVEIRTGSRADA